ncbi:hypothetical protein D554_3788 [Bordetella holmesii 30539]|uniref:Uncharacterized protein n=1 Tax=Bordetella holmesii CDC-H585-BH TaxID=1331206 RepID=A0A158M4R7_9BORD|nr:hypothetical protein D555_3954 [Bordetella holmesii 35009]EXF88511.1 hypothetical protein D554_3788 [Bordetella holmesii 30539]KAK95245.1 hypothetical protein L497_1631 [Bordetella holmesii CDC-H585-BH]
MSGMLEKPDGRTVAASYLSPPPQLDPALRISFRFGYK